MHRKPDRTRQGGWRRGLTTAAALGCAAALTGCSSGSSPEGQRDELVAATTEVIAQVVYLLEMSEPQVLDDGSEPVRCAGGERYQYVAYGLTAFDAQIDVTEDRLDRIGTMVLGTVPLNQEGGDLFNRMDQVEIDLNSDKPRQLIVHSDQGPQRGATLSVDFVPLEGDDILLRFAATTACG